MKFSKLFLASFLIASSVMSPVLAQSSIEDMELRRRSRDQQQLDIQGELFNARLQSNAQAQQEELIRNIIIGVLIVGGSGGVWFYFNNKSKSQP